MVTKCAGWDKLPTGEDLYAFQAEEPADRQILMVRTFFDEGYKQVLIQAWTQQAFSHRTLVRALHRAGCTTGHTIHSSLLIRLRSTSGQCSPRRPKHAEHSREADPALPGPNAVARGAAGRTRGTAPVRDATPRWRNDARRTVETPRQLRYRPYDRARTRWETGARLIRHHDTGLTLSVPPRGPRHRHGQVRDPDRSTVPSDFPRSRRRQRNTLRSRHSPGGRDTVPLAVFARPGDLYSHLECRVRSA